MSLTNDSLLVEAKKEYTYQLCDYLTPEIYTGLRSVWMSAKTSNSPNTIKNFQERLSLISKWNQDVIDTEVNRILTSIDNSTLDKLIEAVFLSHIKILSIIRTGKSTAIKIQIPGTKQFIHKCYVQCARDFWIDPDLFDDREQYYSGEEIKRNIKRCLKIIQDCIEKNIRDLIPMDTILNNYLNEEEQEEQEEQEESPRNISLPLSPSNSPDISRPSSPVEDHHQEDHHQEDHHQEEHQQQDQQEQEHHHQQDHQEQERHHQQEPDFKSNDFFMEEPEPIQMDHLDVTRGETADNAISMNENNIKQEYNNETMSDKIKSIYLHDVPQRPIDEKSFFSDEE